MPARAEIGNHGEHRVSRFTGCTAAVVRGDLQTYANLFRVLTDTAARMGVAAPAISFVKSARARNAIGMDILAVGMEKPPIHGGTGGSFWFASGSVPPQAVRTNNPACQRNRQ